MTRPSHGREEQTAGNDVTVISREQVHYCQPCGQEVVYLREILEGFGTEQDNCTRVFEFNQACIAMSKNTVYRERSRHIDVRKYYVWELVEATLIRLIPCGTEKMTVEALTKSLLYPSFRPHRNTMLDATSQQKMLETTLLRASACWTWA